MPIFAIETATTRFGRERRAGSEREFRTLELEGPAARGGRNHACLIFTAAVDPARTAPVGYVARNGGGGVELVGWLPEGVYETYREIISAGGALQVHYEPRDRTSGYLRRIAIGRADHALVGSGGHLRDHGDEGRGAHAFAMPL